jgi:hypothetical protein
VLQKKWPAILSQRTPANIPDRYFEAHIEARFLYMNAHTNVNFENPVAHTLSEKERLDRAILLREEIFECAAFAEAYARQVCAFACAPDDDSLITAIEKMALCALWAIELRQDLEATRAA